MKLYQIGLLLVLGLVTTFITLDVELVQPKESTIKPPQIYNWDEGYTFMMYNVQTLGRTKISNTTERDILVNLVHDQDFSILQEVRDITNETKDTLRKHIHPDFEIHESERKGRTSYKESMFFIWNTSLFSVQEPIYHFEDAEDIYEREPYVINVSYSDGWFYLVSSHIQPRSAETEIPALLQETVSLNHTYLLIGDLNADCSFFDASRKPESEDAIWIIPTGVDTTVADSRCTYDRIITNNNSLFSGYAVYDQGMQISDHYPIATRMIQ